MGKLFFIQSQRGTSTGEEGRFTGRVSSPPERSRQPTTFNGANDRSHHQLFESAIRMEKYLFLQKVR